MEHIIKLENWRCAWGDEDSTLYLNNERFTFLMECSRTVMTNGKVIVKVDLAGGSDQNMREWDFYHNTLKDEHKPHFIQPLNKGEFTHEGRDFTFITYPFLQRMEGEDWSVCYSKVNAIEEVVDYYDLCDITPEQHGFHKSDWDTYLKEPDTNVFLCKDGELVIVDYGWG